MSNHLRQKNNGHHRIALLSLLFNFSTALLMPMYIHANEAPDIEMDDISRSKVIEATISTLNSLYVFPEVAKQMELKLREQEINGEYDTTTEPVSFATAITTNLRSISHDKHLGVHFTPRNATPQEDFSQETSADQRQKLEHGNCGFEEVKRFPGNIGYIKFTYFGDPTICEFTADAALNFVANTDAVIFDIRDNGGGNSNMVDFISTYLFSQPTQLSSLYFRQDDFTQERWTRQEVPGKRLANKPVYILTSSATFSAAESFAYDLKNLKRATIVGETTGGAAHPSRTVSIDSNFSLNVPFVRVINPFTKTDWEGTGVTPDIAVRAERALATALDLAMENNTKK